MKTSFDQTVRRSFNALKRAAVVLLGSLAALSLGPSAFADSAIWLPTPPNGNWNSAGNWTPGGPPNGPSDIATFSTSLVTVVSISAFTEVSSIAFIAAASEFGITASPGFTLTISGTGINNLSGTAQNFATAVDAAGDFSGIVFQNSATAGSSAVFTNSGGIVNGPFGGATVFNGTSTAGSASFINLPGTVIGANGGSTDFNDTATAGSASFINEGADVDGAGAGDTTFNDSSSAGTASFINSGGASPFESGGTTSFGDNASAGSAAFSNNNGGNTFFSDDSTAANGTFNTNGAAAPGEDAGVLAFSGNATGGTGTFTFSAGEVAGADGGFVNFNDTSTAGSGTYTTNGSGVVGAGPGNINFLETASAGSASITNEGGVTANTLGGFTIFFDNSTAENTSILTEGGSVSTAQGAITQFRDTATAGNGTFTTFGGQVSGAFGGTTIFSDSSSAGDGTFNTNAGLAADAQGGFTQFFTTSTASNATLIANGGQNGGEAGSIQFHTNSTGGTARVQVFGEGNLDISPHLAPGVTIGSLEGSGNVFLGGTQLAVGSNNTNTSFSGLIADGGGLGGTGGSLAKIGTGTLILTGGNIYTGGTTVQAGRLLANSSTLSATGPGAVLVTNSGSALGGTGEIEGPVTINAGAILSGGIATTASGSLKVADDVVLNTGAIIELGLGPSGAHSTLSRTGGTWTFASNQAFRLITVGAQPGVYDNIITGLAADPDTGSWTIVTPGFTGTFTYDGAGNVDLTITAAPVPSPTPTPTPPASPTPPPGLTHAINLSTRMRVETGDNVGIGGVIITGSAPKHVIIRAIGPSLAQSGVPVPLADPMLELHGPGGTFVTVTNDNWRDTQEEEIQATGIPPTNNLESAIVATLAPGAYTAIVRGKDNTSGVALVEVYDLNQGADSKLANLSTRALVATGDNVVIAGVVLSEDTGEDRIIVRGLGPSLSGSGLSSVLADPTLALRDSNGTLLFSNNDWQDNAAQAAALTAAGLAPDNPLEAGIAATLPPGLYTALLAGLDNGTGIGLVEVYDLGPP